MNYLIVFICQIIYVFCESVRYDNYTVYRIVPNTNDEIKFLKDLDNRYPNLDYWIKPGILNSPVDIMVAPNEKSNFLNDLKTKQLKADVLMDNVQNSINTASLDNIFTWNQYYALKTIHDWLDSLQAKYPGIVKVISGGTSYEGRDLKGVKIKMGNSKRAILIEGGIHAREWISPAAVTYIINELLTTNIANLQKIARSFTWYIFPSINPDGYEYSRTQDRMWRKTRTNYGTCYGADPNRNFDFHWNTVGTSTNICSEIYCGPSIFSEKETSSFSQFISSVSTSLDMYLSFHSYSQLLLLPFGNTSAHLANYDDALQIGNAAIKALATKYKTKYKIGNCAEILCIDETSGTSTDWVKDKFSVPLVYTYEMRDKGKYGFLLPESEIIPNNQEVVDSLIAMFLKAENMGYVKLF